MTEHFSFFDAIQDSNGHYDREYNAQQFTDYFKSLVTTGVMKGAYNQLEVTANGSNMASSVKSGVAFVEGRYYYNDSLLQLTHDTEVVGLSRIDRIVVRMDLSTDARYVKTFIKKGVPSNNPVAPPLTQTTQLYEISLAQVRIVGGQTFIANDAVTDERGKDVICPWAGSKILPNFDNNFVLSELGKKANAIIEQPISVPLALPWSHSTAISQHAPLTYYKDNFGVVHIQGSATTAGGSLTVFTLPVGYRPKSIANGIGIDTSSNSPLPLVRVYVNTNGQVRLDGSSANQTITIDVTFSTL